MKVPWAIATQKRVITNTSRRKPKTFYDPAVVTPELIDEVYASINEENYKNINNC
jgi:hypothetical protein